ncbi:MAG: PDZ domain-containing protein [Planctomycetota bacterium]|nr:PDZ domain-containing protein [Planctomycetota bacterium]
MSSPLTFMVPVLLFAVQGWLFPSSAACAEHAGTHVPAASREAPAMIQALASDSYSTRAQARTALLQLGRAAIEPLEYAVKSDNPEVALRATELLIALRGRGFLGLGLQETEPGDNGNPQIDWTEFVVANPGAPPGPEPGHGVVVAPVVVANQVVPHAQYAAYGVTKPFPAETAGIQPGDKLLAVNDRPIHGIKDLMREVITIGPARLAILLVERGDKQMRVPVILTRNPVINKNNGLEIMIARDPPPPVDLEKELERGSVEQHGELLRPPSDEPVLVTHKVRIVAPRPMDAEPALPEEIKQQVQVQLQLLHLQQKP